MGENGLTASDVALLNNDGFGGGFMWIFGLLILMGMFNGGWGGMNNGVATSAEVQRGFDTQNLQAQTRDILSAVTNGTAQSVAATNQTFHDMQTSLFDKYSELSRDIAGLGVAQAQLLANQNECCCSTKMMIAENTQKVLDVLAQNKIEALQQQVNALQLQAATAGVLRYPTGWTYNAGVFPPVTTATSGTTGA